MISPTSAEEKQQVVQIPLGPPGKPSAYDFFHSQLRNPRLVLAPMVDQSELAWRLLGRRYGAQLCYTPMIHSKILCDALRARGSTLIKYRDEHFVRHAEDRPLFAQFCGNDPQTLVEAAQAVVDMGGVDAVDLNLGCPQGIARRGYYGAFLMDDWDLVEKLVMALDRHLNVPVTAKIRIYDSVEKTVAYARMLERAGAKLLTVHGRRRDQKGCITGLADWDHIRQVKAAVSIPVIANGNILYARDVQACLKQTQCDAVMTAETHLHNPCIFSTIEKNGLLTDSSTSDASHTILSMRSECMLTSVFRQRMDLQRYPLLLEHPPAHAVALEYLFICSELQKEDTPLSRNSIRGHLFKLLRHPLDMFPPFRQRLGQALSVEDMIIVVQSLGLSVEEDALSPEQQASWSLLEKPIERTQTPENVWVTGGFRVLPYWVLQPLIRTPTPEDDAKNNSTSVAKDKENRMETHPGIYNRQDIRARHDEARRERKLHRKNLPDRVEKGSKYKPCSGTCTKISGAQCSFGMCQACCRQRFAAVQLEEWKGSSIEELKCVVKSWQSDCGQKNHNCAWSFVEKKCLQKKQNLN